MISVLRTNLNMSYRLSENKMSAPALVKQHHTTKAKNAIYYKNHHFFGQSLQYPARDKHKQYRILFEPRALCKLRELNCLECVNITLFYAGSCKTDFFALQQSIYEFNRIPFSLYGDFF